MNESKTEINSDAPGKNWQKSPVANLVRYISSRIYFARFRVVGKLIRKSIKTNVLSVAKLRLKDLEDAEQKNIASGDLESKSSATFADAIAACRQNGFRPAAPRNKKDAQTLKPCVLAC